MTTEADTADSKEGKNIAPRGSSAPYRAAMNQVLKRFGGLLDSVLFLVAIVCALRMLLSLSSELRESVFTGQIDAIFGPLWVVTEQFMKRIGVPLRLGGVPTAPGVVILGALFARNTLNWRLDRLVLSDRRRRAALVRDQRPDSGPVGDPIKKQAAARRVAVASYTEARAILEATKMELAFLSLDVVGSTKMKHGEDPYVVEKAFLDYREMVEKILRRNNAYKSTWTPDGQMAAFKSADEAVRCGQEILTALEGFNRNVSKMKTPFTLRTGAHCGIVSTDDATPMERVSDFSIDVTGHMQKHAGVDRLWISERLHEKLSDRSGFESADREVDGFAVYEWSPSRSASA